MFKLRPPQLVAECILRILGIEKAKDIGLHTVGSLWKEFRPEGCNPYYTRVLTLEGNRPVCLQQIDDESWGLFYKTEPIPPGEKLTFFTDLTREPDLVFRMSEDDQLYRDAQVIIAMEKL